MKPQLLRWAPAILLGMGATLSLGIRAQHRAALRAPLQAVVPRQLDGRTGQDQPLTPAEVRVAGVSTYLLRNYPLPKPEPSVTPATFSVYVGYYEEQTQGKTIHSPKNCLPGSGWEPLASRVTSVSTPQGPVMVNRYLLQNQRSQALVLYWYQGRGRVEANEYRVKWDLLRDAALRGRTEEALVRIVVPIDGKEDQAFQLAARVAARLVAAIDAALPLPSNSS